MSRITLSTVSCVLIALLIGAWLHHRSERRVELAREPVLASPPPSAAPEDPVLTAPLRSSTEREPIQTRVAPIAASPRESAWIRVLVLDKATSEPFSSARVVSRLEGRNSPFSMRTAEGTRGKPDEVILTGSDGRVEIEMLAGVESRVSASHPDSGSDAVDVAALVVGETRDVVLRLPTVPDLPFWMRIVDEATRDAFPRTRVIVTEKSKPPVELATDERGLVFCTARSWSLPLLRVEPEQRALFYVVPERGHTTVETALVVTVPRAASLRIVVTDAAGAPMRNAEVLLSTSNIALCRNKGGDRALMLPDPSWSARTDAAGIATLAQLPVRVPLRAAVTSPVQWDAMDLITLEPGERTLSWRIGGGGTVRGQVLDQYEKPVADRTIWLRRATRRSTLTFVPTGEPTRMTKSDAEGRFRFEDVETGAWSVGPGALNYGEKRPPDDVVPLAQLVEIVEGQRDADVTIRVDRGLFIRGRVVGVDGEVPYYASVRAYFPKRGLGASTTSQRAEGKFEIGPLTAGRYEVVADSMHDRSDRVEVDAGTDGVELRLKSTALIRGRVVDGNGETVLADVTVTRHGFEWVAAYAYNRNDMFEADRLDSGTYHLAAVTADGRVGVLEGVVVTKGDTRKDLTLTVVPGGRVRVRHDGPESGLNATILQRGVVFVSKSVQPGAATELVAPAGTVVVRANYVDGDRRAVERSVEVKAGETIDVTFEKGAK